MAEILGHPEIARKRHRQDGLSSGHTAHVYTLKGHIVTYKPLPQLYTYLTLAPV